ncbi:MAG: hypothetical protein KAY21_09650, partial [Limnohabitans sp.]|nr:hypothetical protein [Limnohabitans sp.]
MLKPKEPSHKPISAGRRLQPRQKPVPKPPTSELKLPTYKGSSICRSAASAPTKSCAKTTNVGAKAADLQGEQHLQVGGFSPDK